MGISLITGVILGAQPTKKGGILELQIGSKASIVELDESNFLELQEKTIELGLRNVAALKNGTFKLSLGK